MKFLIVIALFITGNLFSQTDVGLFTEELPNDSLYSKSVKDHVSVHPLIRQTKGSAFSSETTTKNYLKVLPLSDVNGSYSNDFSYRTGLGVALEASSGKWYFRAAAVGGVGSFDSVFHTNAFYKEPKTSIYVYTDVRGRISYTPNDIFNFQIGLDNQFIGQGNRSLFLSDYASPSPFAQIRTRFWRLEYTIMYQFFREKFGAQYRSKYGASHHISLNATKWLNIGVFESVIFRPKDTLLNRGYDAEYLNPVIFYRPQEYSLGSSDNVLLGFSADIHWKQNSIYSQVILDEFNLGEIRAKTGWWANKFGVQLGYKSHLKSRVGNLFYRLEYNFVRPYTYAHIDDLHNYGTQSASLAHPLGSNFHEILGELKWQKNKWLGKVFASYSLQGVSKDSLNYGNDIYQPYINRPSDYGNYTGQGKGINSLRCILTIDYTIVKSIRLHAFLENHLNYSTLSNSVNYYPVIGIRSQLWNDYRNY